MGGWNPWFEENQRWPTIDTDKITKGIAEVDVLVNDNGEQHNTTLFGGHVGVEVKRDEVTLQPVLGWALCLKRS